jgi:hypothetical protein
VLLIGLRRGSRTRLATRSLNGGAVLRSAEELLAAARACDSIQAVPDGVMAAAKALLEEIRRCDDVGELGTRSIAARLAKRVRARLAELPFGASGDLYSRADGVLNSLASVSDLAVEDALSELVLDDNCAITDLLGGIEKVLSQTRKSDMAEAHWELSGVIAAD